MKHADSLNRDLLIAYSLLPFLTPARLRLLFDYFESPQAIAGAAPAVLSGLLNISPRDAGVVKNPLQLPHIVRQVESLRTQSVTLCDTSYSPLLREIIDPPPSMQFLGDIHLLSSPAVAIVGSRRASEYAMNVAHRLARELAEEGVTIVSGLARGIDTAAHRGALAGGGKTIAVLGTGLDVAYPRSNRKLHEEISRSGLLLSQFAPGTPPHRLNFPMRNRIIAGLASGTIVVEATSRSGSLITARLAAEQGREVFAVPGSVFSAGSEGTHRLIQYGAKLLHDVEDVFAELPSLPRTHAAPGTPPPPLLTLLASATLEKLRYDEPLHIDQIAAILMRPVGAVCEELLELELKGLIRHCPGARYIRSA